jgi:hypothetical protein
MKIREIAFIYQIANRQLLNVIPDSVEREEVLEKLIPEIEADIEETAVREFISADVEIALARALYKKLS